MNGSRHNISINNSEVTLHSGLIGGFDFLIGSKEVTVLLKVLTLIWTVREICRKRKGKHDHISLGRLNLSQRVEIESSIGTSKIWDLRIGSAPSGTLG